MIEARTWKHQLLTHQFTKVTRGKFANNTQLQGESMLGYYSDANVQRQLLPAALIFFSGTLALYPALQLQPRSFPLHFYCSSHALL